MCACAYACQCVCVCVRVRGVRGIPNTYLSEQATKAPPLINGLSYTSVIWGPYLNGVSRRERPFDFHYRGRRSSRGERPLWGRTLT